MAKRRRGPIVNRRHLARQERERLQSNYIMIGSIVTVVIVVLLVVTGFVVESVVKPRQPVALVNSTEISSRAFQARVRYQRNLLVNRYRQTLQTMQLFGNDPNTQAFFQNSLNQIEFQLEPDSLGRDVLNTLIEDELVRQEAAKRGITVTKEEVDTAMEEFFGYFGGGQPPTPTEIPTSQPTSTLTPLQMTMTAPTPTPVLTQTESLTSTEAITGTGIVSETVPAAPGLGVTETLTSTPAATVAPPTPTPYTLEAYQADYRDNIQFLNSRLKFTEEDLRNLVESQLYREKLLEAVTADVAHEQEQVWARHILVEDEQTALEVIARLQAGEDFAALVQEYSTDTATAANGGDLGWFGFGQMVPDFEKVAFNLAIGEISDPVQSTFGWHVIQVLGHEVRPLTEQEFQQLRQNNFNDFLSSLRLQSQVEIMDYWAERVPTDPDLSTIANPAAAANPQNNP